jgi:tRNA pseudouridine55 synthase
MMSGFINLNKPWGITSHDCIAKLRKLLQTKKIGHGGTLDPFATGVLPIAVGKATRLLQFLPTPKAYRARIRLGMTTTTDDLEGEVIKLADSLMLDQAQILDCLNNFRGTIEQVPPIYSAIKQKGRKLYDLARRGEEIAVEARQVTISELELLNIAHQEFCELEVAISCSPGTYIRAIARDLGAQLGVGGTLAHLIRTESCGLTLENSFTFEQIEQQLQAKTFELIDPKILLTHLDTVSLSQSDSLNWCQGQLVDLSQGVDISNQITTFIPEHYLATYNIDRTFLGISILYKRNEILKLKPKIVLG